MTKQNVIIFDGPDMTGKTEISKRLSEILSIPRFKNPNESISFINDRSYFENAIRYADPYFVSYLKQTNASVILDRSFPSEFVYSKVFNRQTDEYALNVVDKMYANINTKIILTLRQSYTGFADDQFSNIDHFVLQRLHDRYIQFSEWTKCKNMLLYVDDNDLEREISEILTFLDI